MIFTTQLLALHEGNLNISKSISVNRFEPFEHRLNDDQLRTNKIDLKNTTHTHIHTQRLIPRDPRETWFKHDYY